MIYSKSGLQLTEGFEGCRLQAYQDSKGVWTIGHGHTSGVCAGMTCTQAQAEAWLAEDVAWAERAVNWLVRVPVSQGEFEALVDFVFNAGIGNFRDSALLHFLNVGRPDLAAAEFDKWDHCGGKVVAGLLRRRQAEKAEFQK